MAERVHFIPVGFDFDRLIHPISKGELNADRVVLITHKGDPTDEPTTRAAQLAESMSNELERTFELIDIETERRGIDLEEIYDYEFMYPLAHRYFRDELRAGNDVYVNISSMPRTVSFAFATAANSLITEQYDDIDDIRNRLHTYYVAPKEYLVLEMLDALEGAKELFESLREDEDLRVHKQLQDINSILNRVEKSGVTEGTRDQNGGKMFMEFPTSPTSDVEGFEEPILRFLRDQEQFESTSELAKNLAEHMSEEYNDSFRSRVQYNVTKLEDKGYVKREEVGNSLMTRISTMGKMWVKTH